MNVRHVNRNELAPVACDYCTPQVRVRHHLKVAAMVEIDEALSEFESTASAMGGEASGEFTGSRTPPPSSLQ